MGRYHNDTVVSLDCFFVMVVAVVVDDETSSILAGKKVDDNEHAKGSVLMKNHKCFSSVVKAYMRKPFLAFVARGACNVCRHSDLSWLNLSLGCPN